MAVRKVGTCRIVRELGRGGMGVVYEGVQEGLERRVAVKTLDARLTRNDEVAERFRREGRAYAQLRHDAVVMVHDLVEKEESLYLVTELVDGPYLGKVLAKGGALPPDCVAVVGTRLADALDYVHFNKLLHRDVKTQNVMRDEDGRLVLTGFGTGLEHEAADEPRPLAGTPLYLAPELLQGGSPSPQSDLYSLGGI